MNHFAVVLLLFLSPVLAMATFEYDWSMTSHPNGRTTIQGPSCEELRVRAESLAIWKARIDGGRSNTTQKCSPIPGRPYFYLDITDIIPTQVSHLFRNEHRFERPNCWNTVLYLNAILPQVGYTDDDDFTYNIESPLCRELELLETLAPGDIGRVVQLDSEPAPELTELHAFIYIDEDLFFEKQGWEKSKPWRFVSKKDVTGYYEINPEHQRIIGPPLAEGKSAIRYYRCSSALEFFTQPQNGTLEENRIYRRYKSAAHSLLAKIIHYKQSAFVSKWNSLLLVGELELLKTKANQEFRSLQDQMITGTADPSSSDLFILDLVPHFSSWLENMLLN